MAGCRSELWAFVCFPSFFVCVLSRQRGQPCNPTRAPTHRTNKVEVAAWCQHRNGLRSTRFYLKMHTHDIQIKRISMHISSSGNVLTDQQWLRTMAPSSASSQCCNNLRTTESHWLCWSSSSSMLNATVHIYTRVSENKSKTILWIFDNYLLISNALMSVCFCCATKNCPICFTAHKQSRAHAPRHTYTRAPDRS